MSRSGRMRARRGAAGAAAAAGPPRQGGKKAIASAPGRFLERAAARQCAHVFAGHNHRQPILLGDVKRILRVGLAAFPEPMIEVRHDHWKAKAVEAVEEAKAVGPA